MSATKTTKALPLGNGWFVGVIGSCRWEAKAYDAGSKFGINNGRVSKLWICNDKDCIYNYDRGLDFDNAPEGIVDAILAEFKEE